MSQDGELFINKLSKNTNLNITKSNSTKKILSFNSLVVRKLNQKEKSNNIITKEIHDYLYLPEKYFSPNSRVVIGKKVKLKDMKTIKIEPDVPKRIHLSTKKISLYRKSYNINSNNLNLNLNIKDESFARKSLPNYYNPKIEKLKQSNNDKYEIIDNEQLKKIFNKYKTYNINSKINKHNYNNKSIKNNKINKINKNNKSTNNIKSNRSIERKKDLPFKIAESLSFQNNKIKKRQKLDNKVKKISKYISKLINKKENDLLLNRVDDYSFKKELLKEIDYNRPIDQNYGINKWKISLRRQKNFEGMRNAYINVTSEQNPFWGIVVEKSPIIKEIKIKPGIINKNKLVLEKFKKTYFPLINYKDCQNLENLDTLTVKGKNLFNIEYNREIKKNKGTKILHKIFIDKGGKIFFKTDINNIFGEMTFYENYNTNSLSTTHRTNFTNINSAYNTFTNRFPLQKNYNKSFVNIKDGPNSSIINDEILKKSTFSKSKSSVDI